MSDYSDFAARTRERAVSSGRVSSSPSASPRARQGAVVSRVPMPSGTYGSQRMGWNPDAFERFPYGSRVVSAKRGTALWNSLSPAYMEYVTQIAKHPTVGTKASTGRMLWERMNDLSADRQSAGENISPQMLIDQLAASLGISDDLGVAQEQFGGPGGGGGYGRGGFGGGGGSSTQQTIDITTPTGARALLTQAMQGLLGRDPSDDEIATFTTALNESQRANPQVVTAMGDTVTRSGGFEADVFAMDFAKNQEEFQEVQGTQFYRALMDALGGGGI